MATVKKGSKAAKAKMAKVRAAKKLTSKVNELKRKQLRKSGRDYQTSVKLTNSGGRIYKYNRAVDEEKKAQRPGKRVTDWGTTYYERRVNRSDAKGSLTGLGASMYDIRDRIEKELNNALSNFNTLKFHKKSLGKNFTNEALLKKYPKYIASLKKQLREQNKVINSNLR